MIKEKMKAKGADTVQSDIIEGIKKAALENDIEMDADTIGFVTEKNISTHHADKSLQEVLELMIDKLRNNMKTVDTMQKPQIVMLTQDTLKVTALYKALRDKYAFSATKKPPRKKNKKYI